MKSYLCSSALWWEDVLRKFWDDHLFLDEPEDFVSISFQALAQNDWVSAETQNLFPI